MKVREIMSSPVVIASEDATMGDVARLMLQYNIGAVPIVDARGRFAGVVTELDFAPVSRPFPFDRAWHAEVFHEWLSGGHPELVYERAAATAAGAVVSGRDVPTLTQDDRVDSAIELFLDHHVHAIPVLHDGVPVGIVTRHDLIRMMVPDADATPAPAC
jgi:CBS domain-containing protein